jgi:hypothetical protein
MKRLGRVKKKSGVKWVYRNGFWKKIGAKKNALDPQQKEIKQKTKKSRSSSIKSKQK